jgi:hypothetical protein
VASPFFGVRFIAMNLTGRIFAASLTLCVAVVRGADPAAVDYTQRNAPFAPGAGVKPEAASPAVNEAVQTRRVETDRVEKKPAAVGARRAPIEVREARDKSVHPKKSRRAEASPQPMSPLNQRTAPVSTSSAAKKPPLVSRYQDSLAAASAANMARFPAADAATTGRINRFVFKKNAPDPGGGPVGAPVTPAGGGSAIHEKPPAR